MNLIDLHPIEFKVNVLIGANISFKIEYNWPQNALFRMPNVMWFELSSLKMGLSILHKWNESNGTARNSMKGENLEGKFLAKKSYSHFHGITLK